MKVFKEYQLSVIPRIQNHIVDALAVVASLFQIPIYPNRRYHIEVKHRPSSPNNVKYWQVFEDDSHINKFLTLSDEFENLTIDGDREEEKVKDADQNEDVFLTHIADNKIIQWKNNSFPKGLVPLEEPFDHNDVAKCPGMVPSGTEVEDCNIGTDEDPKIIKISTNLPSKAKGYYLALLKEYSKVFASKYEDLKVYDTSVINILYLSRKMKSLLGKS